MHAIISFVAVAASVVMLPTSPVWTKWRPDYGRLTRDVALCASASPPLRTSDQCQPRNGHLSRRIAVLSGLLLLPACATLAAAEDIAQPTGVTETGDVMHGVLQATGPIPLPIGSKAVVTMRVVGRNTKGPLSTVTFTVPENAELPLPFAIRRSDLREGAPDYLWEKEDLYVRADLYTHSGKTIATGRSKAKAISVDGKPAHAVAFTTME